MAKWLDLPFRENLKRKLKSYNQPFEYNIYIQSSVKNQLENIPSNNTFHISPFYLRYPRQPWLSFK